MKAQAETHHQFLFIVNKDIKMQQKENIQTFSFDLGEPVSMLDKGELLGYFECAKFDKWYSPPVSFRDISRLLLASAHHQSALEVKKNILLSTVENDPLISFETLEQFVQDYLILGNGYLQVIKNKFGEPLKIVAPLAKYVRVGTKGEYYYIAQYDKEVKLKNVFHFKNTDVNQNIYGLPPYLGAIQSLLLNESATLFRRKYYVNGAHAGSIIYANDSGLNREDVAQIQRELAKTKGQGNFKNVFIYAPNGKPDGLKVIPLSDAMGKDEFLNIKNTSRDDVLAAHRVPPQLIGVIPSNNGGFGDAEKAARVFFINEIKPLQRKLKSINEWLKKEVLKFGEYELSQQSK